MNKMLIISIGFVILSNFYYALAEPENNNEVCVENFSKLEPSLSLITSTKNPVINKGDTLEFEIYITGYGTVANSTKIYASLPIGLVDSNTTYGIVNHFSGLDNIREREITTLDHLKRNITLLDAENGFNIVIPSYFYSQVIHVGTVTNCYSATILTENKVNISNELTAPILVKINTSENAPEGDNNIDLFFIYSDGKKLYQDKNEVNYRRLKAGGIPLHRIPIEKM